MKADFARLTFDPTKHYRGVLHQQGRVWLEADWNEEVYSRLFLTHQQARDTIGVCGVPEPGTAFQITPNPDASQPFDFLIGGGPNTLGHCYVNGILCELDASTSYLHQTDFPDAPMPQMPASGDLRAIVYLEVWQRLITYLEDDQLREIALGGPDTTTRLKTIAQVKLLPLPSGVPALTRATALQFLPVPGQGTLTTIQPKDNDLFDPCRLPDPATFVGRENHLYRVEIHNGGDVLGGTDVVFSQKVAQDVATAARTLTLQSTLSQPQIDTLKRSSQVTILDDSGHGEQLFVADATNSGTGALVTLGLPISGSYTVAKNATLHVGGFAFSQKLSQNSPAGTRTLTLQNPLTPAQLDAARRSGVVSLIDDDGQTEIVPLSLAGTTATQVVLTTDLRNSYTTVKNATVIGGVARFKWSRDNAAFAVEVTLMDTDRRTLTLASLGRDQITALRELDLVEVSDDASELGPGFGHLTYLASDPDPDQFTVTLADPLPDTFNLNLFAARHLTLRRWDGQGMANTTFGDATTPDLNLGDGVRVQFGGADLRPGDYWQFAARTADGSVEALQETPAAGIHRSACPLALVRWSPQEAGKPPRLAEIEDCRVIFLPLAEAGSQILDIRSIKPDGHIANGSDVRVDALAQGIQVVCNETIDPLAVLGNPVCTVTLEMPFPINKADTDKWGQALVGYQPLTLSATLETRGSRGEIIVWLPTAGTTSWLLFQLFQQLGQDSRLLAHLKLMGNAIWSVGAGQRLYLDGEGFGMPSATGTDIQLPSGDGRRGGMFHMWFWLIRPETLPPPALAGIALSPTTVTGGNRSEGTIILSGPAPTQGVTITLASATPAVAQVPATITVGPGLSNTTFTVDTSAVSAATTVNITASINGGAPPPATPAPALSATLTVQPPSLAGISLDAPTVIGTMPAGGTVTLTGPAPASGVIVNLTSNNIAAAPGSPTITVAVGQTSVHFPVTTTTVRGLTPVTISATIGSVSMESTTTVEVGLAALTLAPSTVVVSASSDATVSLSGPASADTTIILRSNGPVTAPSSVVVSAGQPATTFRVTSNAIGSATITATEQGLTTPQSATLQIVNKPKEKDKEHKDGKDKDKETFKDARDTPVTKVTFSEAQQNTIIRQPVLGPQVIAQRTVLSVESDPTEMIRQLTARVNDLEQRLATGRSFIRADERPAVGEAILNEPQPPAAPPPAGPSVLGVGEPEPPTGNAGGQPPQEHQG